MLIICFAVGKANVTRSREELSESVSVTTHIADHRRLNRRIAVSPLSVIRQRRFNTVTGDTATEI